jgi:uncharacterized protein YndB with AHSA1/START domain
MSQKRYSPTPAASVSVRQDGQRWTLLFTRELSHPPERVWTALTDPIELREWAPFDADRHLGATGSATLTIAGNETVEEFASVIRRADAPRVLEYTWGDDVLRWELEPIASGTKLTLSHTLDDRSWVPKVAAGWHICLDVADQMMRGDPTGRIVGDEAKQYGWEPLNDRYAEQLGIVSTGFPTTEEQMGRLDR